MKTELEWHKGPGLGGKGTAESENGIPQWYDGERLLIALDGEPHDYGTVMAIVDISADEDVFDVTDAFTGEMFEGGGPEHWLWWAKLTKNNLPPA